MGSANPLFAAITTSDQDTLQQLQGEAAVQVRASGCCTNLIAKLNCNLHPSNLPWREVFFRCAAHSCLIVFALFCFEFLRACVNVRCSLDA